LSTGTNLDNIHDKMNKDRSNAPKGERSWSARLTEDNVLEIRSKYAAGGISQKDLAIEYGVLAPAISQIINRKKWKHI
jgi:DNA transposition AAA+ family ATPase